MSRSFNIHRDVRGVDLPPALAYYRKADPSLPERFLADLDRAFDLVEEHPLIGHELFEVYRRVVLAHFPYLMAYRVTDSTIRVLALVHGRRDPDTIKAQIELRST